MAGLGHRHHEEFARLHNAKVLLRAHGEPPETYALAKANHIEIIDATCPVVLRLQKRIKQEFDNTPDSHDTQIVIYGKNGHTLLRTGSASGSHRLLAGENALLLTTAFASNGRLSGRGCCKESCPVHRICRMIVRILVRNSQIVNIFGTSSEDALIQKSVLQKFLGDFCSCVKRKKLYTSTNEKSSRSGLDFHTLMC